MPLHLIQDIGSYGGFVAIVGLAVLSALYFSQARDVKRLREWAGRAPERGDTPLPVPGRATSQGQAQPQAQPRPRPAVQPATAAAAGAAPASVTGPPTEDVEDEDGKLDEETPVAGAGTGEGEAVAGEDEERDERADGETDAESEFDDQEHEDHEPVKAGVAAAAAGTTAATAAGRSREGIDGESGAAPPSGEAASGAAAPSGQGEAAAEGSTAAPPRPGGAPGAPGGAPAGPTPDSGAPSGAPAGTSAGGPPITRGGFTGVPGRPTARPGSPPLPGRAGPPPWRTGASQTAIVPPPSRPPWYRRVLASPRYLVLAIAGVLIIGGGAAFGVTQLTKDDSTTSAGTPAPKSVDSGSSSSGDSGKQGSANAKAIDPKKVTVAVLNGTTVPGLAAQLGDKIKSSGFQLGNVSNSTDQQRAESAVLYAPGHAREAAAVGRRLGLGQRERIDSQTQGIAGDATVVVVAGIDQTR